jgi:hypothetical protein
MIAVCWIIEKLWVENIIYSIEAIVKTSIYKLSFSWAVKRKERSETDRRK